MIKIRIRLVDFNYNGDHAAVIGEIDVINNGFSRTDVCELSNSKMVDLDGSNPSTHSRVTDGINILPKPVDNNGGLCSVRKYDNNVYDDFRLEFN